MDVRALPALPVAPPSPWRRRLVAALALSGAALVALPAVRATPTTPRLYTVTAEVFAPPGEPPYACRPAAPRTRSPEERGGGVIDRCIRVPVAGVTTPGLARLVGSYRNGVFYVIAQGAPGPLPEPKVMPPVLPYCCPWATRYTREQVTDAWHEARLLGFYPRLVRAPDGEPMVTFHLVAMTEEVEAFVASQPPGLVQPTAWLELAR